VPRHVTRLVARLVVDYVAYAARPGASAHRAARRRLLCLAQARRRLLRLRCASGCLGSSRGPSSTTTPMPRVRVPRHVARLIVNYFAYAARPGASAHRAARRRLLRHAQVRRRLLRLRRVSGCLSTSRGSSSTTSPTLCVRVPRHVTRLVVDYFAYAARPGASAHRAARCRQLRLTQARHLLLRLRRASGCLGMLRGSSRGQSSTTSPTPRVRVPQHVTQLVARLVVDYFAYVVRPGASTHHVAHRRLIRLAQARRRLLRLRCASGCLSTSRGSSSTTSARRAARRMARR
jgi:predicted HAD superfamily phosphohydrolase YqeG